MCLLLLRRFSAAVLFLSLLPALWAQSREVAIGTPAFWAEPLPLPTEAKVPEAAVEQHYLLFETQTHVAERAFYRHVAYRILNEGGLRYGAQLNIPFDPLYQTLTLHQVRIVRGDTTIDRLDRAKIQVLQRESDLEYLLYDGSLTAHLILDDVRVGDLVEYSFTRKGFNPVFGDRYLDDLSLGWGSPVSHLRHRVIMPKDRTLEHRLVGSPKLAPEIREISAGREFTWERHDVPALVFDRAIPAWHTLGAWVQLTEFTTWREVVEWAEPLYAVDAATAAVLREKMPELFAPAPTPEARALRAVEFVQDQIRYLGIEAGPGSHRPSPPAEVLTRRFGDCKDKARLLVTLLREMGYDARPVLVHSSSRHTLLDWLPSPYAFNHVIVQLKLEGREYVLDPTLTYQRGDLGKRHTTRYHAGLVIDRTTTAPTVWPISANDTSHTLVEESYTATSFETPAQFHVRTTYSARRAASMRSYFAGTKREDISKSYLDYYARYFPEITVAQPVSWRDDPEANTLVVEENYTIPNLFRSDEKTGILKADFHPTAISSLTDSPGAGGRNAPLAISHPQDTINRVKVTLPEPWPEASGRVTVSDPAFEFERNDNSRGKIVEWAYRWRSKADHVTVENFAAYRRNLSKADDAIGRQLTYDPKAATVEVSVNRTNWAMAALGLVTLGGSLFVAWRLGHARATPLNEPPPLEPYPTKPPLTGIGGWLILIAIGVVVRPFTYLYQLKEGFPGYFNLEGWRLLTTPGSEQHVPYSAIALPLELVLVTAGAVVAFLLPVLFFGRRKVFPSTIIGLIVLEGIAAILQFWWTASSKTTTAAEQQQSIRDLMRGAMQCAIWIPYFCVSRRVKNTFTR